MSIVKHGIAAASVAIVSMGAANLAEAKSVTYVLDDINVSHHTAGNGLLISVDERPLPGAFTLDDGECFSFKAFDIWTDETDVAQGEDTVAKAINATFEFSSPLSTATVGGETDGIRIPILWFSGAIQYGAVSWAGPAIVDLGDVVYKITLGDAIFNKGLFGLSEGECYGATITAKVEQISSTESTVVPTPSAALAGLAMMGGMIFRRNRASA